MIGLHLGFSKKNPTSYKTFSLSPIHPRNKKIKDIKQILSPVHPSPDARLKTSRSLSLSLSCPMACTRNAATYPLAIARRRVWTLLEPSSALSAPLSLPVPNRYHLFFSLTLSSHLSRLVYHTRVVAPANPIAGVAAFIFSDIP